MAHGYQQSQIRYLRADDARRILEARAGEQVGVSVLYSSRNRSKASGTGYLQALYFTAEDLLITLTERDRFESTHRMRIAPGTLARAWKWCAEQSNQRALAILGGGIAALAAAAWTAFTWWYQARGGST